MSREFAAYAVDFDDVSYWFRGVERAPPEVDAIMGAIEARWPAELAGPGVKDTVRIMLGAGGDVTTHGPEASDTAFELVCRHFARSTKTMFEGGVLYREQLKSVLYEYGTGLSAVSLIGGHIVPEFFSDGPRSSALHADVDVEDYCERLDGLEETYGGVEVVVAALREAEEAKTGLAIFVPRED